ncbi:hypothetical protein HK100_001863 [Physocladia obscura]|uniref:Uncharacterized protein n=1 Tax=Physocladia obscura TaxID=109957 RepID=A0AAD5SZA6_9FUNG|nr:hypothetical protein HK100_001863 [Physocladia obscura]
MTTEKLVKDSIPHTATKSVHNNVAEDSQHKELDIDNEEDEVVDKNQTTRSESQIIRPLSAKPNLHCCSNQIGVALQLITKSEITAPAQLPEGLPLTVLVAKKLNDILTHWNGIYDGDVCVVAPEYTFKYKRAFADIQLAAIFLGTSNDNALVLILKND